MFKNVHHICCGIDVHKKFAGATIDSTIQAGTTDYSLRQFLSSKGLN